MKKILIAEDEKDMRDLIMEVVEGLRFVPVGVANGKAALDFIRDTAGVSMLITDVKMPEMDGITLVQTLRADPRFKKLPILIMSAYIGAKDIAQLLDMGATAFLAKPVKVSDIEEYVMRYLENPEE